MRIKYQTERLHHALHPLFLSIDPYAEWMVGEDTPDAEWYFMQENGYRLRTPQGEQMTCEDLYAVKRYCYDYYQKTEGLYLPWGIVSGIRPTKLARQIYESYPEGNWQEFARVLWQWDRISSEKAKLLWQVLQVENEHIAKTKIQADSKEPIHLYLGIPFCPSRCYYCSFSAGIASEQDSRLPEYVDLLKREIRQLRPIWKEKRIRTIYFGGGTPTILTERLLEDLLSALAEEIEMEQIEEFTVEAGRPDTITTEKLDVLKKYGVGRISINPQSFSDRTLVRIARNHTVAEVQRAYDEARRREFRINMDLIFGLHGENLSDIKHSAAQIVKLRPENVTVHTLTPKRGADLSQRQKQNIFRTRQEIGAMLDLWQEHMNTGGWQPYYLYRQKNISFENVGYALPETECIYNMETMLERDSIIALGAGSISKKVGKDKISRYDMPKELGAYHRAVMEGMEKKRQFFL